MISIQKNTIFRGPFLVLLGALCFSTSGTIQAISPQGATPFVVGALRLLIGGIALFLWCLWQKKLRFDGIWDKRAVIFATIGIVGFQLCFFSGVKYAGVAVGTVVAIGFSPIAVAILGFIFNGECPQKSWYFATLLAIIGLFMLNYHAAQTPSIAGIVLPLAAGIFYGIYFIFSKPLVQKNPSELVMMVLCLWGSVILFPLFFIYPISWIFTISGMWATLGLGVLTTAIAYSFLLAGLKNTPSATASTLSLAEPLGAACWGILFLGEPITRGSAAGIICIFLSVLILIYFYTKAQGKPI